MRYEDFYIGIEFTTSENKKFRCTDVGTRIITAIELTNTIETTHVGFDKKVETIIRLSEPLDFLGPPYKVVELVFDEYDFPICKEISK